MNTSLYSVKFLMVFRVQCIILYSVLWHFQKFITKILVKLKFAIARDNLHLFRNKCILFLFSFQMSSNGIFPEMGKTKIKQQKTHPHLIHVEEMCIFTSRYNILFISFPLWFLKPKVEIQEKKTTKLILHLIF